MPTNLGSIGLGTLGVMELDGVADRPDVDIVAGSDVSPEAREEFESRFGGRAYADHEEMLDAESLDAVLIVTPHTLHYDHAVAALDRDLDVLLEKPMVTETSQAVDLVQRAEERGCLLTIGYQRHLHPGYRAVREVCQSGRIGAVHMAACYLAQDWIDGVTGSWRADPDLSGGGQLIDSGSHLLDALLWTTAAEPEQAAAVMDYRDHAVDVNTALSATLDGPDGPVTASIGISADGTGFEEGILIWGTDGHLTFGHDGLFVVDEKGQEHRTFDAGGYEAQTHKKVIEFVDAVQGTRDNPVPGEFGVRVTALTEAAYLAHETGETVDVRALVDDAREAVGR